MYLLSILVLLSRLRHTKTMPELPEVQTVVSELNKRIVGRKIKRVAVNMGKIISIGPQTVSNIRDTSQKTVNEFVRLLQGRKFTSVRRRGKMLIFDINGPLSMLVHLKMTGQLIYRHGHRIIEGGHNLPVFTEKDLPTKYTLVIWKFNDGGQLYFNDMRKFGYLKIVDKEEKEKIVAKYGIEPLTKNFTLANFRKVLGKRKTSIKAVLLNQALVAGIGNIYADEICFAAGIRPDSSVAKMGEVDIKKVFTASEAILKKAIAHKGTTFRDYVNAHGGKGNFTDFLKVYQRDGEKCLRCKKGIITKNKTAGRGSHYCPACQKMLT